MFGQTSSALVFAYFLGTFCPTDWYYYNGYCYYPSDDDENFRDSRKICQKMNADLVSITDQNEMDFVLSISYEPIHRSLFSGPRKAIGPVCVCV